MRETSIRLAVAASVTALVCFSGCSPYHGGGTSAGHADASVLDAGRADAGMPDASEPCAALIGSYYQSAQKDLGCPGTSQSCYWLLEFNPSNTAMGGDFAWQMDSDSGPLISYTCTGDVIQAYGDYTDTGTIDPATGDISWEGVVYVRCAALADQQQPCAR